VAARNGVGKPVTPKERIFAAVGGKAVDRRPVTLVLSLYGARLTNCPLSRYYSDPAAYAEGQTAVLRTFEPDLICGPFALAKEAAAFGCCVHTYEDQAPVLRQPGFHSAAELTRHRAPTATTSAELAWIRDSIAETAHRCGAETPVAAIFNSPIDLPTLLLGVDLWMETLLCDETAAVEVLAYAVDFVADWANTLLTAGASLVLIPLDLNHPEFIPQHVSDRLFYPALSACLARIRGPVVLHHGGLPLLPVLPDLKDLPNVVGFVADPSDSLAGLRAASGENKAIIGNISGPRLFEQPPEEIYRQALAILQDRSGDARFILGTSAADIPLRTEPEQVWALRKAADNFAEEALR
jgi:uroporphyrinogen decarboxylase